MVTCQNVIGVELENKSGDLKFGPLVSAREECSGLGLGLRKGFLVEMARGIGVDERRRGMGRRAKGELRRAREDDVARDDCICSSNQ